METLADPGTVPGATGAADSHEPPDVVAATAVKVIPAVPPIVSVCAAGAVPPMAKLKVSEVGMAVRFGETTKVTGITTELAPVAPMVTVPL